MIKKNISLLLLVGIFLISRGGMAANPTKHFEFEESKALPLVYFNLILNSGAAHDPKNKLGLANIAGQMILRGTLNKTKLQIFDEIDRLGGEFEVNVLPEGTVFSGAVLSDNLLPFLSLVEEFLTSPRFEASELRKIKKEVEGQILEQKGQDSSLARYHFYRFLYLDHPYSNPVLGTRAGVEAIAGKDIVEYYTERVASKHLAFVGTGDANSNVLEEWYAKLLHKLDSLHPTPKDLVQYSDPTYPAGRRLLLINKPNSTQAQVLIGGAGIKTTSENLYSIQLANFAFGGPTFNSRLLQELRVKRGWTYGASNNFSFGRSQRHFATYFFSQTDKTLNAINLALEMIDGFAQSGITQTEFDFSKGSMTNNAPFDSDTPEKRIQNATTELLVGLPRGYFKNFGSNIEKVGYEKAKISPSQVLNSKNLAIVVVGDAKKLQKGLKEIPGIKEITVKDYKAD